MIARGDEERPLRKERNESVSGVKSYERGG